MFHCWTNVNDKEICTKEDKQFMPSRAQSVDGGPLLSACWVDIEGHLMWVRIIYLHLK